MSTRPRRTSKKPIRISYEEFRGAVKGSDSCACSGGEAASDLAELAARNITGAEPAAALDKLLDQGEGTPVHGIWHHVLVGQMLLMCLRNAGYQISEGLVDEVVDRGKQIPGGSCGFLGTCGALVSAASAYAILLSSTPVATEARERLLEFSSKLAARLAEVGGSRCCKKSSYAAFEVAQPEFARLGFELPKENFESRCRFFGANDTCDGADCVYFPKKS